MEKRTISMLRFLGLMIAVCMLAGSALGQFTRDSTGTVAFTENLSTSPVSQDSNPPITLELDQVPLKEALKRIAGQAKAGLYYNAALLPEKTVSLHLKAVPLGTALRKVLEGTRLQVVTSARNITLRPKSTTRQMQPPPAHAQETIIGTVTDGSTGNTLPGVNIKVKGTTTGTATGPNGQYELTVESLQDTLVFSFVGYRTQEVPINGRTEIDIEMQSQAITGQELVVTALGIRRESRSLGYSVSTVEPEEITKNRTANFMQSLQGKVAGVNISSMATGAGGASRISIRGQSSITGDNQPLIVVDGTPIDNTRFYGGTQIPNNSGTGDGLLSINPDDIKSMDILKGGAAAALYGSRAKDGVIMITTKKNAGGRGIGVKFNSNFVFNRAIDDTDFQYEYGQGERGQRPTSPFPDSGVWSFGEKIEPGMTQILFDGEKVPYEPQRNQITDFYDGGYTATNTLSLATGDENGGLNLSISQLNNDALTPNSSFKRQNIDLGFTKEIISNFNVSGNIHYSLEKHTNPTQIVAQNMTTTKSIYTMANTMPLYLLEKYQRDENGNEIVWSRFKNRTNPYLSINDYFNDAKRDRIFGNIQLRYDLANWLYLQGRIGQDYYARDQKLNFPSLMAGISPAPAGFVNGRFTRNEQIFREINADFLIGFKDEFDERFGIDVSFGGNIMRRRSQLNSIEGQDFIKPFLYTLENSRVKTPLYNYSERQVNSLYTAAKFSYNDYLFLNFTARNDWFSTLAPSERSILYPSVSGSFLLTDVIGELPDWLNLAKIRASYSEVGSDTDIAPFSQTLDYQINSNFFQGPINAQPIGSISSTVIPNPHLRPMRVKEYDVGFNMQLFKRINLDFTYYHKLTIDQILNAAVSNTSGFNARLVNVGESVNRGIEGLLDITAIESSDFLWNATLNASYNTSEVLRLGINDDVVSIGGGRIRQVVGKPLGQIYAVGYRRNDQGRKIFNPNNGLPLQTSERINVGSTNPNWIGGIGNTFRYKNFSLYALVDFKLGYDLISSAEFDFERHGKSKKTLAGREQGYVVGDGVTPDGSENTTKVPVQTYYEADARIWANHLYNAGFWKLRQVSLTYNFTNLVSDFIPVQGLTLSAVAHNLYTIKTWTPNLDPEMVHTTNGTQAIALPLSRSFGLNLEIEF